MRLDASRMSSGLQSPAKSSTLARLQRKANALASSDDSPLMSALPASHASGNGRDEPNLSDDQVRKLRDQLVGAISQMKLPEISKSNDLGQV